MKVASADIFSFALPLTAPLLLRGSKITRREGLLIRLQDLGGNIGWGEASPLPGFSAESLADVKTQMTRLTSDLTRLDLQVPEVIFDGSLDRLLNDNLYPSTRFAVETALVRLFSCTTGEPMNMLFSNKCHHAVAVNALLHASPDSFGHQATRAVEAGFDTIKMKVGGNRPEVDARLVHSVRQAIPNDKKLRLDANRRWSLQDALLFTKSIGNIDIEYIEEPVAEANQLKSFMELSDIPVALDETLTEISPAELPGLGKIAAVVIKPTLLGGFGRAIEMARAASAIGARIVLSSTFETGLTIHALAEFASALCEPETACGFDTLRGFERDILSQPFGINDGKISLRTARQGALSLDESGIDKICS